MQNDNAEGQASPLDSRDQSVIWGEAQRKALGQSPKHMRFYAAALCDGIPQHTLLTNSETTSRNLRRCCSKLSDLDGSSHNLANGIEAAQRWAYSNGCMGSFLFAKTRLGILRSRN